MKLFKGFLLISVLFLSFIVTTPVLAQTSTEEIRSFESNISVSSDTTTDITERITYYFPNYRHGIIWRIPYVYSVKALRRPTIIDIKNVSYYPTNNPNNVISRRYSESRTNGWLELKIGDEELEIVGEYVYEIEYTMKYTGIGYFDDHEEIYLNAIGPGWNVPIRQANVEITAPGEVQDTVCYTGPDGSTQSNCLITQNGNTLNVVTTDTLQPFEGLTFAISLPVGTFEDTTKQQLIESIIANIGILLPIPVGIFGLTLLKRKGRNEKLTVVPNFTPEKDWNPLRSGTMYSGGSNNKYISALLVNLAVNSYIVIKQIKKNKYELIKTEKSSEDLPNYVKTLYDGLFEKGDSVSLSKLPDNFYLKVSLASSQLHNYLIDNNLFSNQRKKLRVIFILFGMLTTSIGVLGAPFFIQYAALGWMVGFIISGTILLLLTFFVDSRSPELGNREYHDLLGLKMYINTAEKHRIEFHNDPKKYNQVFEKLLPYAMIFGLEKKWAKEFEDIYTQPPSWYQGDFTTFNSYYLARSLGAFNNTVATKSVTSYSSSGGYRSGGWSSGGSGFGGGGSSGGGGGGSGGGSW